MFFSLVYCLQHGALAAWSEEGRKEGKKEEEGNSIYIRNYVYRSIGVIHLICIRQCGSSESRSRWEGDTVLYHTYLELEFNCSSSSDPYSALDS